MQKKVKLKSSSVITLVIVIIVICTCLALAAWQWQRAKDKAHLLAQQDKQLNLTAEQILALPAQQNNGLFTTIKGRFLPSFVWFLDNQTLNGQVGFDVLALFALSGYTQKKVLVNLGFIRPLRERQIPSITLPEQSLSLQVVIKSEDIAGFTLASEPSMDAIQPQLLQYIDIDFLSERSDEQIFPLVAYQYGSNPILANPHYTHVVMPPEKHKAYALQWLLIALAAALVAYFAIKKGEHE
ncbi:SURF1 family protein [Pseudoalteromonas sp. T1lg23B]|uniref:SURF1 family protein n=1 Tax=Pseudoalteromonas sp. T1lg23B TaxID=2077097 RepID=UPI000CF6DEB5|nr:SURF1 family protein [Pseudoalteromonas sp. T1lg23B]